jgi:diamine N-acetyltransferase
MDAIVLRPSREADLDFVLECERDPAVAPYVSGWTRDRHREALADPDCRHHILTHPADGRPLGFAMLFGCVSPHRCLELRRLACRERGRGFGRSALRALRRRAFDELGAHRLWLDVQLRNPRAIALYRSEGFREEGVLRECLFLDGHYLSMALMSMLRHERPPED